MRLNGVSLTLGVIALLQRLHLLALSGCPVAVVARGLQVDRL